jgi:hypothetical protein
MEKKERAAWINAKLDEAKVPEYGRAATIAKRIDCSNAVCQGWLQGSLPKDLGLAIRFSKEFGIDLEEWATGASGGGTTSESRVPRSDAVEAARLAREIEQGRELSEDQFLQVVDLYLDHGLETHKLVNKVLAIVED